MEHLIQEVYLLIKFYILVCKVGGIDWCNVSIESVTESFST